MNTSNYEMTASQLRLGKSQVRKDWALDTALVAKQPSTSVSLRVVKANNRAVAARVELRRLQDLHNPPPADPAAELRERHQSLTAQAGIAQSALATVKGVNLVRVRHVPPDKAEGIRNTKALVARLDRKAVQDFKEALAPHEAVEEYPAYQPRIEPKSKYEKYVPLG